MTLNVVMCVAWLGATPRHKGRSIIPRGKMAAPMNLTSGTTIGHSLVDPRRNWSKSLFKMMLAELSLSTNTQCTLRLTTTIVITRASSWGVLNMTCLFLQECDSTQLDFQLLPRPAHQEGLLSRRSWFRVIPSYPYVSFPRTICAPPMLGPSKMVYTSYICGLSIGSDRAVQIWSTRGDLALVGSGCWWSCCLPCFFWWESRSPLWVRNTHRTYDHSRGRNGVYVSIFSSCLISHRLRPSQVRTPCFMEQYLLHWKC